MRDRLLQVRLGADELAALDRVSARFDLPRSELVRIWIRAADELHGRGDGPVVPLDLPALDDLLAEFSSE